LGPAKFVFGCWFFGIYASSIAHTTSSGKQTINNEKQLMTARIILQLAALLGALGVGIGAFGAHGLRPMLEASGRFDTFETAVRYQFYHTLALLAVGVLLHSRPELRLLSTTAWLWLGGVLIFSGSLYLLCFTGVTKLGAVAPIGGLLLIAGWITLLLAARQA
jgi:uncharacterized membrane protein YgdD (TMEM256/DUF423 family)